jgi:GNAT superfamily N-acetyltransferase
MDIRTLTKDDIADCARLLIKSYNQPPWRYNWTSEKAEPYLLEYFDSKQFVGFMLFDKGEMAGAVFAHTKTWWTTDQLYIDEIFISGDKQRAGYGKALLEHISRWSREHGFPTVFLMTNKFMPSFKFYNKNDFSHAEHFIFMFKQV